MQDDGEPGLAGVGLRLFDDEKKVLLPHDEVFSDANGMVRFEKVPKVKRTRIQVTTPPKGAVRTQRNRGGNDEKDSDLRHDNFSDPFRVSGGDWKNTALGYLLPQEVKVLVFNDLNGNGIQDEGERGLRNVVLRLETRTRVEKENVYNALEDQGSGGNAHEELTTDVNGYVTFVGVPQKKRILVAVVDAPEAAIPTAMNRGGDDTKDSDLGRNGKTGEFTIKGGSGGENLALGFRMPESVIVRVWDDANSNGKQDKGEAGLKGIKLALVNDDKERTDFVQEDVEGTADDVVETDELGFATFTKVRARPKLSFVC